MAGRIDPGCGDLTDEIAVLPASLDRRELRCVGSLTRQNALASLPNPVLSDAFTLYSYICDLKRGEIYIYNFHDFEQFVKINLQEELAKGEGLRTIASLFPYETFAERRYKAWRIVGLLCDRAIENGLEGPEGAVAYYHELRAGEDRCARYEVNESQLLAAGYRLLEDGKNELAIGIFELNVSEHPASANAYDSLGEAYAAAGRKDLAIRSCENSLALDPNNDNARRMLEDLRR